MVRHVVAAAERSQFERVSGVRAHDLLEAVRCSALVADVAIPGWVVERYSRSPLVVVRRAPSRAGYLPVGVRGNARNERFAAWLSPLDVGSRITPESLVRRRAWENARRFADVPHFALLDRLAHAMHVRDLAWGLVGSLGYELASGVAAVTAASDIDVIVRVPVEVSRELAASLSAELSALPMHIDVQLETPYGAMALAEYAAGGRVALRTLGGPRLVDDPWRDGPSVEPIS